ncbi:MAG: acyltransferase [Akkermansia sp.]|nr:acyltransferase [Akkermansia sp.]
MSSESKKSFLPHINGLRCVAIMMIVLFHIFPHKLTQGFLGVEVFFVISGYLLFYGYKRDEAFSFVSFIRKKILRIMPPYVWILFIVSILSFPLLFGDGETNILGKSVLYSLCGVSNYYYDYEYSDYFSAGANMNPLLHTWYLSIIIQVYVIWALGCKLFSLKSVDKNRALGICLVVIIALVSFTYWSSYDIKTILEQLSFPVWEQIKAPSYYDTFGRLWQILAGGLVFYLPRMRNESMNALLSLLGLLIILVIGCQSCVINYWNSIVVVLGTILVLRYGSNGLISKLLANRCVQLVGTISFSLYLVHFPIIAIYKLWEKAFPDKYTGILLFCFSLVIGWLFWFVVEKRKFKFSFTCISMSCAFAVGTVICSAEQIGIAPSVCSNVKYPTYSIPKVAIPDSVWGGFNRALLDPHCGIKLLMLNDSSGSVPHASALGGIGNPEFVFIGDSNAHHLYSGMHEVCLDKAISGIQLNTIVFSFEDRYVDLNIKGYDWTSEKANAFYSWLELHPEIHTVVISQLWDKLFDGPRVNWNLQKIETTFGDNREMLEKFCLRIKQMGKNVVLVMPSPYFHLNKDIHGSGVAYARWLEKRKNGELDESDTSSPFVLTRDAYYNYYKDVIELFNLLEKEGFCDVLHLEEQIFANGNYLGIKNGVLYCRDATHITPPAAIELMKGLADDFAALIRKGRKK